MIRIAGFGLVLLTVLFVGLANAHEDPRARLRELNKAIAEDSADPFLVLERANLSRLSGDFSQAGTDLDLALSLGADPESVSLVRGMLLGDMGHHARAIGVLSGLTRKSPSVLGLLGRSHVELGHYATAQAVLGEAIQKSTNPHPDLYLDLSRVALLDDPDGSAKAIAILDEGIRRVGPAGALMHRVLDLETAAQDHAAALRRLDAQPHLSLSLLQRRGEILMAAGDSLEAHSVYTDILARVQALPLHRRRTPALMDLERQLKGYLNTSAEKAATETGASP